MGLLGRLKGLGSSEAPRNTEALQSNSSSLNDLQAAGLSSIEDSRQQMEEQLTARAKMKKDILEEWAAQGRVVAPGQAELEAMIDERLSASGQTPPPAEQHADSTESALPDSAAAVRAEVEAAAGGDVKFLETDAGDPGQLQVAGAEVTSMTEPAGSISEAGVEAGPATGPVEASVADQIGVNNGPVDHTAEAEKAA
jgi:hypothetical protein